jgi:uncharacterized protein (TIGR02246 family)
LRFDGGKPRVCWSAELGVRGRSQSRDHNDGNHKGTGAHLMTSFLIAAGQAAVAACCRRHLNDLSCVGKLRTELIMRRIALVIAFLTALTASAFAQKAEIDAVNAKWVEFFNKGDFTGVASLYTEDATAFPPGSSMVKGRPAIGTMWKNMAEKVTDPQLTTLDVKPLGPSAAREIGTFSLKTKGPTPQEVTGKYVVVWEKVGGDWKLAADIWNEGK